VANPAHLEKLCEGPKVWNAWREANPNIVPDLSEIQLTLHQRQLGPSTGGPVDLHGADLERAVLRYATLSGADLEGARLVGADLTHARLDGARLIGADLTDALLDQADLTGALLDQAVLFGADLSDTRNLTLDQLEEAFGDASTRVPGNLLAPESWFPRTRDDGDDEDDYAGWGMAAYEQPAEVSLYEVLGLTEKAESEEIRTAYRALVKKLHPDINPGDEAAQEQFKRVTTAYRILNDAEQRGRYDRGEIDGDGRVNPEFEARRQFRRTAFRYYAAAAGSFVLAIGVLGTVWYTVLPFGPAEEVMPQVSVVSQPKRGERLGGERLGSERSGGERSGGDALSARADKNIPQILTEELEQLRAEGSPVGRGLAPTPVEAPKDAVVALTSPPAAQAPEGEPAVSPPPAENPAPARKPEAETAAPDQPASPPQDEKAQAPATPDKAQNSPAPEDTAPASPPAPNPQAAQTPPPTQLTPGAEEPQRPLYETHQGSAGQTSPFAPDGWTVVALPPGERQAPYGFSEYALGKSSLPQSAQRPAARDMVSKVLRTRALSQAFRSHKRPIIAIEGNPPPERRAGLVPDVPTNALPVRRQEAPAKPKPGGMGAQRKPQPAEGRSITARRPQAAMAASADKQRVPALSEGPRRLEIRRPQQQAVSDILAGGM
jgi:hypothetical protein